MNQSAFLKRFLLLILITSSGKISASDYEIGQLSNEKLKVNISNTGKLLSVENYLASEKYAFISDAFELDTDLGILSNRHKKPTNVRKEKAHIIYQFDFDKVSVDLIYTIKGENSFIRRALKIVNNTPMRLKNVRMGKMMFSKPAEESIHYITFWMAPTVEFIRYNNGGIFTGIENPFYRAELDEEGVALNFEPGLILKSGEGYESEPQFIGVYKKSGVLIEDSDRPFRYPNGSGYVPIDRNESRAMRAFALDYLNLVQDNFLNINYQFFHPLPQMPKNDTDKLYFTKTIDAFKDIGGDMIIFKPLHPYKKPDAKTDYWNVIPEEKTTVTRQIVDYARQKGISYGFYMGIAAHGQEGNAAGLPFRTDKPEWKKKMLRAGELRITVLAVMSSMNGGFGYKTILSGNIS